MVKIRFEEGDGKGSGSLSELGREFRWDEGDWD